MGSSTITSFTSNRSLSDIPGWDASKSSYLLPILPNEHNISINGELLKVNDWLVTNRLSLNVNKTKCMIFHNSQKDISNFSLNLILNHGEIEKVSPLNFLGVILHENIHWMPHIENVACKLAKYCGLLSKLTNFLPLHILWTLYYSKIHAHLNYGLLVRGFQCNRIVKLQKSAIRTITRRKYNAHTSPLLKHIEILSVNDMLHQKDLHFIIDMWTRTSLYYFDSFDITTQGSLHNYNTDNLIMCAWTGLE